MKKKIMLLVLSIVLVLIVLVSSTYSLVFKVDEFEQESYLTGVLSVTSNTLNDSVTLNNSIPMTDDAVDDLEPYTFEITNVGDLSFEFDVKLLPTNTGNLIDTQYIKIQVDNGEKVRLNTLDNGKILEKQILAPGSSVKISLKVWLSDDTTNDQIGKNFNAKITTEGYSVSTSNPAYITLSNLGLTDSIKYDTPDFSKTSCSEGCEESTVGIYSMKDDLGLSYYFRGDVENNYVWFADSCWRILRINGDGTVRIIYEGTSCRANGVGSGGDGSVATLLYNYNFANTQAVGYMFDSSSFSSESYYRSDNLEDSEIKNYLEGTWYQTLGETDKSYISDAIYCNDRDNGSCYGHSLNGKEFTEECRSAVFDRLAVSKPQLVCNNVADRFTDNDVIGDVIGNGELDVPVGLITADEIVLAGASGGLSGVYVGGKSNNKYFLYDDIFTYTMSPYGLMEEFFCPVVGVSDTHSGAVFSTNHGFLNYYLPDHYQVEDLGIGVKPVISLKSNVLKYSETSNGSMKYPFVIE